MTKIIVPHTYPGLDSLRAVGAYCVVITHVAFQTGMYPRGVVGGFFARLDVGVAIFFVLSGFLLSMGFLRPMSEQRPGPEIGRYFWKRFLRIWPVFTLTVIAALALVARDTSAESWLLSLSLTHLYSTTFFTDGLTQMWSLETEVAFYLVLPLLMWAISRLMNRTWMPQRIVSVLVALVILNWLWVAGMAETIAPGRPFVYQWLPAYISWFAGGIGLAVLKISVDRGAQTRILRPIQSAAMMPGALWILALSLLLIASTPVAGPLNLNPASKTEAVVKNAIYLVFALAVILPAILRAPNSRYVRALSWRPARFIGEASFGIFCVHLIVLHYAMKWTSTELFGGNFLPVLGITIALSTVVASLLYVVVERSLMRLKNVGIRAPSKTRATAKPSEPAASN